MTTRLLTAWQRGQTGYPIVDAGMRQLWHTGWMHNRVRMIAASFLVKHLLQDWRAGEAWFWDTLVDADPASNPASWQWVAGCGADAAPYFRIFNPVLQGEKFDPDGDYVRRWVPELARLPNAVLHKPWTAPKGVLAAGRRDPRRHLSGAAGRPPPGPRASACGVPEHQGPRGVAIGASLILRSGREAASRRMRRKMKRGLGRPMLRDGRVAPSSA